jgi:hypothetical protein
MKKLKLDPDALRVQPFATTPDAGARRGTVAAFSGACATQIGNGCGSFPTEVDPTCICA